jgi:hypothetical protein
MEFLRLRSDPYDVPVLDLLGEPSPRPGGWFRFLWEGLNPEKGGGRRVDARLAWG